MFVLIISLWHSSFPDSSKNNTIILSTHFCVFVLWYWTLLLHVSVLYAYFYVCHGHGHGYFMYLYHRYTNILLQLTLLFYTLVSPLHGYLIALDTVVSFLVLPVRKHTREYDMPISCIVNTDRTFLLYGFTYIHALIVHIFLLHGSYLDIPVWPLNASFLNTIHDYFLYHCIDMKLLLPGHNVYWYSMCETMCHVKATSSIHGGHL